MTHEAIAGQLGYVDRRNVHNYWMAFKACGEDLWACLSRKKEVDDQVVSLCQQIWRAHPLWSAGKVHETLVRCFPERAAEVSAKKVRRVGHQIGCLGIQSSLKRQLTEGEVHVPEPVLLDALLEVADAGARVQADGAGEVRGDPPGARSGPSAGGGVVPWGSP
jgi:hypothetical protein